MTPLTWLVVVGAAVIFAVLTTHWLTAARGELQLQRKTRSLDERNEQQRVQALARSAGERLASETAAHVHAGVQAELARTKHDLDRAEARVRLLGAVCRIDSRAVEPLYPERPAPLELDAISGRVRGLAFIDSVSIADASGLPLDRASNRDADDLAALVPIVGRIASELDGVLGEVSAVAIQTVDTRIAEFRALPAWTGGAWLVAQSSSQRPPAGALDAAVAFARVVRDAWAAPPRAITLSTRGRLGTRTARTESLADELDRACRGLDARTVALVLGDQILTGFQTDGLAMNLLEPTLRSLHQLQQVARARLRADAIARIDVDLVGAARLSLSSLGTGSRLGLVTLTVGRPLDTLEVERVVGRLRRFLDTSGQPTTGSGPVGTNTHGAYA